MSDSESRLVLTGRLFWMFLMCTPMVVPLGEIALDLQVVIGMGSVLGLDPSVLAAPILAAPIAGLLVGYGERRYGSVLLAGLLTVVGWSLLLSAAGGDHGRLSGDPRLIAAEFLLYVAALSLAVVVVFFVDWRGLRDR